ncbi:ABC transporter permease [Alteribacillus sp. JSM 102045]|uniref:ABC transporter permease n=1 Tax=Alteribacillus sp. JSM 102045 TaxID=1562101 RepID=UPI0035BF100E
MKCYRQQVMKPYLLLLPSILVIGLLVGYGVLQSFMESLRSWETGSWTFQYYHELFTSPAFWDSFFHSLYIAAVSTFFSLLIGILLIRIIYKYFIRNKWKVLVWVPMLIPHLVAAYLVILFFSESGLFSSFLFQIGWIEEMSAFPISIQDRNGYGIILTYIWKEVPFVILMLLPVYYQLEPDTEAVIRTLGGGYWEVFKTAEWPRLFPVVVETGIILFSFTIAAFEVPYVLGVTYPKMLPLLSHQWFFENDWGGRPLAYALMSVTTLFIAAVAFIAFRLSQKRRLHMTRGR